MLKKIFAISICFVMLLSFTACKSNSVATIDDEKIDSAYFQYYFTELKSSMQQQYGENTWQDATLDGKPALDYVRERALQAVIDDKLIMMKVAEDGIKLTDKDKEGIASVKKQWIDNYGSQSAFEDAIEELYGISESHFDYMLEAVYYRNHIIEKYVTDEDSQNFYNENIVKVKHILIPTVELGNNIPLTAEKLKLAEEKLELVLSKIENGVDFDTLVAEYTEDQDTFYYVGEGYSLNVDGSLGSGMVSEFETAAFALGTNEISGVVESPFGYHIIKRYENDEAMFNIADETLSSILFSDVIQKWKEQREIVINESIYNSYK